MNNPQGFISVVIPTRDRSGILRNCLDAFELQTLPREQYELVVVDDGSTDGTSALLEELSRGRPSIRYFSQAPAGPAKARNLGVEKARGPFILFTGDDCIPDRRFLHEHLRAHAGGEPIAVLGHIDWHPDLEVTPFMAYISLDTQFSYPTIRKTPGNVPFGYFYTSNISIAKKHLEAAGGFDEEFTDAVWEDVELGYRIWRSGVRMVYNSRAVTYHHHRVELKDYAERQIRCGRAAAILYRKHPELAEMLRLPRVSSPEVRMRYYQAVLDYYYYLGLQGGLAESGRCAGLISLDDRLANWSAVDADRLASMVLNLEKSLAETRRQLAARDRSLQRCAREIERCNKLIGTLNEKNQEKFARIVELEKLELRLKGSIAYRAYSLARKLLGRT